MTSCSPTQTGMPSASACGDDVGEIGEPALRHEVGPGTVPGGRARRMTFSDSAMYSPRVRLAAPPQRNVGETDVVVQTRVLRVGDRLGHLPILGLTCTHAGPAFSPAVGQRGDGSRSGSTTTSAARAPRRSPSPCRPQGPSPSQTARQWSASSTARTAWGWGRSTWARTTPSRSRGPGQRHLVPQPTSWRLPRHRARGSSCSWCCRSSDPGGRSW
jgi:hypothetical protein